LDWAPKQTHPDALLAELIGTAPLFDADALDWRSRLKLAGRNAACTYRGDIPNMTQALSYARISRVALRGTTSATESRWSARHHGACRNGGGPRA
jgi:hypothetical protein